MKKTDSIPFGFQFIECPTASNFTSPTYDEDEDLSVFINEKGQKIPSVEYYRGLGTKSMTKVQDESTDDDESSLRAAGTRTVTEVQEETTDSDDDQFSLFLNTKTATAVQSEESDDDPTFFSDPPKPPLTTTTHTYVLSEETDSDN